MTATLETERTTTELLRRVATLTEQRATALRRADALLAERTEVARELAARGVSLARVAQAANMTRQVLARQVNG